MYKYKIVLTWSESSQEWIATIPELPAIAIDGKTPQEAIDNVQESIRIWLKVAQEEGRPIPLPQSCDEQHIA
jgi:predicted RNase H-like HicB family nuclease